MEIKINKDLSKYKTKDFFMFSFREVKYVVIALALFIGLRILVNSAIGNKEVAMFCAVMGAIPPLALGFYKPKGYYFKDYLKEVTIPSMTTSKEKIWKSDFVFDDEEVGNVEEISTEETSTEEESDTE